MLWVKAFHIIFMVTWFAGLFYLPRLFVYHAMCEDAAGHDRFVIMERKLFILMTIGGTLTSVFGLWLLFTWYSMTLSTPWMIAKLILVAILIAYHIYCLRLMSDLKDGSNRRSHTWFRWFNEAPSLLLIAIILLVELQPIFGD